MKLRLSILLAALAVGLVATGPAQARSHDGGGEQLAAGFDRSDVPARVKNRVKRTQKALNRAEDRIDDGESGTSALSAVRRNLAAAVKAANRRIGSETGPASVWFVSKVQGDVVESTSALFDGADDALVADLGTTLDAAIGGRDELIAAIAALSAEDQQDYADALVAIDEAVTAEIEAIDEALADDTLTADAEAALNAAREKLVATQDAVAALLATLDTEASEEEDGDGADEDCPGHRGGPRGSGEEQSGPAAGGRRGGRI